MAAVETLHGTLPAEIFQSGLENVAEIEAVAVSVMWKNGTVTSGWSNVDASKLSYLILSLDEKHRRENL